MQRVGVDIGGTFTDLVGLNDGQVTVAKLSTTPNDPTRGVADAMDTAQADIAALSEFLHGTTIAINTVLERKGAKTALITTEGFRDAYEIGRGNRPEGFNLDFERPEPLVPRDLRMEVRERLNAKGEALTPLDAKQVEAVADDLVGRGVESIAVCFLHSYANPAHERTAADIIRKRHPAMFVTESHAILRAYREYERTSTTVLNAYVGPRVRGYLDRLEKFLGESQFRGGVHIMRSNGGTMSLGRARIEPVSMMESGPVAGMIAVGHIASLFGIDQCIGFDMGGTTAKASLVSEGRTALTDEYFIGGYASGQPMQLPVVDIAEVGAGGGSIAWIDRHGGLHVGPRSAGAEPGPACYGRGGAEPVVTDADLLLGRLNGSRFLGGAMGLDRGLAAAAVCERIAAPLGLEVSDAALGIARIADAAMSLAIRAVSVERGFDPRDCALVAFGGAGPLHALSLAHEIFIPRVIIPKLPGNFSALGILLAEARQDYARTFVADLAGVDPAAVAAVLEELLLDARSQLLTDGATVETAAFAFSADLRYLGQEHSISVPFADAEDFADGGSAALKGAFNRLHDQRYGHSDIGQPIQFVNLRLTTTLARGRGEVEAWLEAAHEPEGPAEETVREVTFERHDEPVPARILWRPALAAGVEIEGPAVIEEANSTTLVFPGDRARITEHGHIDITLGAGA